MLADTPYESVDAEIFILVRSSLIAVGIFPQARSTVMGISKMLCPRKKYFFLILLIKLYQKHKKLNLVKLDNIQNVFITIN